jgi:hypothetical protein
MRGASKEGACYSDPIGDSSRQDGAEWLNMVEYSVAEPLGAGGGISPGISEDSLEVC